MRGPKDSSCSRKEAQGSNLRPTIDPSAWATDQPGTRLWLLMVTLGAGLGCGRLGGAQGTMDRSLADAELESNGVHAHALCR